MTKTRLDVFREMSLVVFFLFLVVFMFIVDFIVLLCNATDKGDSRFDQKLIM